MQRVKSGDMYAQAMEETGLEYKTVKKYKSVAKRVELSLRRDNLPFSHHEEVAYLDPDEQQMFLEAAASLSDRERRKNVEKIW